MEFELSFSVFFPSEKKRSSGFEGPMSVGFDVVSLAVRASLWLTVYPAEEDQVELLPDGLDAGQILPFAGRKCQSSFLADRKC
jgi:hypothetical protein